MQSNVKLRKLIHCVMEMHTWMRQGCRPVGFLLVGDQMFYTCYDVFLHALNGGNHQLARKVRIRCETFPQPSVSGNPTKP
jgi:hypothetical protein